jgi:hypothetical protein
MPMKLVRPSKICSNKTYIGFRIGEYVSGIFHFIIFFRISHQEDLRKEIGLEIE